MSKLDKRPRDHMERSAEAIAAAVKRSKTLERLNLGSMRVGDSGAKALGDALASNPFSTMTTMCLGGNKIGVEGAKALALALQNQRSAITTLHLDDNEIGDEGVKAIADGLMKNPQSKMKTLHLCGNTIGDEGARALALVLEKSSSSMKRLDLWSNPITIEGTRVLAAAVPRSLRLTKLLVPHGQFLVDDAFDRAADNRRVLALMSAVVSGRARARAANTPPAPPAERFVMRDGDNAIAHRIAWFLVQRGNT